MAVQCFRGRLLFLARFIPDFTPADQWQAHVRQWRQVTRSANTAPAWNPRHNAVLVEGQELIECRA
jgi:hypothetical protein